jgi:hypothetical protein
MIGEADDFDPRALIFIPALVPGGEHNDLVSCRAEPMRDLVRVIRDPARLRRILAG